MNDSIRKDVSRTYAEALKRSQMSKSGSCCGDPQLPDGSTLADTTVAAAAGYGVSLAPTHAEAAQSSFGCGNPLAFAGVEAGQTVVDLGSGAGLDLLIAADKVGPSGRVIGVDMTGEMIAAARHNLEKAGVQDHAEVREGLIEDLPVADRSADWVISNCVINLSTDKPAVFGEIARVLKPGGQFSISDIVVNDLPDSLRQHALAYSACIGGAISEEDYVLGLQDAGLTDVLVEERIVYTAEQLKAILSSDFGLEENEIATLKMALQVVEGKVWSAKFRGRRST